MSPLYTTLSRAPFSPSRLFRAMEQGLWIDPSDLTIEKISWRRNLLLHSEKFNQTAWTKQSVSVTANAAIAPDGTLSATLITETAANSQHYVLQSVASGVSSVNLTFHLKPNGRTKVRLRSELPQTGALSTTFDLTGSGSVVSGLGTITALANGWYRCTAVSSTAGTGASGYHLVQSLDSSGLESYLGDGVSGFYLWGAHLERGTSFSGYQKITDFNSDFLAAYPHHTLYQDAAGTTSVSALGQPVGLILDKRNGVPVAGAEILTNGDFSAGSTGWTNPDTAPSITTFSGGAATMTAAAGGQLARLRQSLTLPAGTYLVSVNVVDVTGTPADGTLAIGKASSGDLTYGSIDCRTVGLKTKLVHISGPTLGLAFTTSSVSGAAIVIDNVSVKLLHGNHAYQTTAASRPTVEARVNLTTNSEGAAATWTVFNVADAGTPIAGFSASLAFGNNSVLRSAYKVVAVTSGISYSVSIFIQMDDGLAPVVGANSTTGDFVLAGANLVGGSSITTRQISGSLYRVSAAFTAATTANTNSGVIKYTTQSARTFRVIGIQVEEGTTATTYQRVNTATDYVDVGAPRYLQFDGADDFMVTNSINFTGTDKMTLWAGVRKLGGATAVQSIVELSAAATNPGVFSIFGPRSTAGTYNFLLNGSAAGSLSTSAAFPEPVTNVLSCSFDISKATLTEEIRPRVNAAVPALAALDAGPAGTGNFGNYPLYIGRRGGTSLPFNGRLYGLIVRGAASNADQIATVEAWMNSKTRAY